MFNRFSTAAADFLLDFIMQAAGVSVLKRHCGGSVMRVYSSEECRPVSNRYKIARRLNKNRVLSDIFM